MVRSKGYIFNVQCVRPRATEVPRMGRNENVQFHRLHIMYIPFDAALLYGPIGRARISSCHDVVTSDFTAQQCP